LVGCAHFGPCVLILRGSQSTLCARFGSTFARKTREAHAPYTLSAALPFSQHLCCELCAHICDPAAVLHALCDVPPVRCMPWRACACLAHLCLAAACSPCRVDPQINEPQALCTCPTRELVMQVCVCVLHMSWGCGCARSGPAAPRPTCVPAWAVDVHGLGACMGCVCMLAAVVPAAAEAGRRAAESTPATLQCAHLWLSQCCALEWLGKAQRVGVAWHGTACWSGLARHSVLEWLGRAQRVGVAWQCRVLLLLRTVPGAWGPEVYAQAGTRGTQRRQGGQGALAHAGASGTCKRRAQPARLALSVWGQGDLVCLFVWSAESTST